MTTTSISLRSGNRFVIVLISVSLKCSSAPAQCCFDDIILSRILTDSHHFGFDVTPLARWHDFGYTSVLLCFHFGVTQMSLPSYQQLLVKISVVWSMCSNYSDITVVPNGLRQMMGFPLPKTSSLHPTYSLLLHCHICPSLRRVVFAWMWHCGSGLCFTPTRQPRIAHFGNLSLR